MHKKGSSLLSTHSFIEALVTVSSHGDITTEHFHCQGFSQPILLKTNSKLLLTEHSRSVLGSLLTVVSLLDNLTVPSPRIPVWRVFAVKKMKLTLSHWMPSHLHERLNEEIRFALLATKQDVILSHPHFVRYKPDPLILTAHLRSPSSFL